MCAVGLFFSFSLSSFNVSIFESSWTCILRPFVRLQICSLSLTKPCSIICFVSSGKTFDGVCVWTEACDLCNVCADVHTFSVVSVCNSSAGALIFTHFRQVFFCVWNDKHITGNLAQLTVYHLVQVLHWIVFFSYFIAAGTFINSSIFNVDVA